MINDGIIEMPCGFGDLFLNLHVIVIMNHKRLRNNFESTVLIKTLEGSQLCELGRF